MSQEGISEEVRNKILNMQKRCVECGDTYALHIHHRVFRSEHEQGVKSLLDSVKDEYEKSYSKKLEYWGLHDIQNLIVICLNCHEGQGVGVHGGNEQLRQKLRNSFTCPITGCNIKLVREKRLF